MRVTNLEAIRILVPGHGPVEPGETVTVKENPSVRELVRRGLLRRDIEHKQKPVKGVPPETPEEPDNDHHR